MPFIVCEPLIFAHTFLLMNKIVIFFFFIFIMAVHKCSLLLLVVFHLAIRIREGPVTSHGHYGTPAEEKSEDIPDKLNPDLREPVIDRKTGLTVEWYKEKITCLNFFCNGKNISIFHSRGPGSVGKMQKKIVSCITICSL